MIAKATAIQNTAPIHACHPLGSWFFFFFHPFKY
jgi:hypothetical protein